MAELENAATQPGELSPEAQAVVAPVSEPKVEPARAQPETQPAPAAPTEGQPKVWPEGFEAKYPQLVAKFKSPEEMAESYANLERRLGTPETPAAEEPEGEPEGEEPSAFFDRLAEKPQETIAGVAQSAAMEVFQVMTASQAAWNALAEAHPDAKEVEKEMGKYTPIVPTLMQAGLSLNEAVERVYLLAKGGGNAAEEIEKVRAETREQTLNQVRDTTVESGRGGGTPQSKSFQQTTVEEIVGAGGSKPTLRPM